MGLQNAQADSLWMSSRLRCAPTGGQAWRSNLVFAWRLPTYLFSRLGFDVLELLLAFERGMPPCCGALHRDDEIRLAPRGVWKFYVLKGGGREADGVA